MENDTFDPLYAQASATPSPMFKADPADPDSPYEVSKTVTFGIDQPPVDLSTSSTIEFTQPDDPLAVRFGSVTDPMQLDMDPFGKNTVEWGKANGEDLSPEFVKSANVFGHVMSREALLQTEHGRKLIELMEDDRNGRRRGFFDAIKDFQPSDFPFLGMFASVGKSVSDAITVGNTMENIQNGVAVDPDDAVKTRLYFAEQEHMQKGTWGSMVGDIVRAAPGFMVEFWGSGLIAKGVRGLVSKAAEGSADAAAHLSVDRATKYATRDFVEQALSKEIGEAGTWGWKKVGGQILDTATDVSNATPVIERTKAAALEKVLPLFRAQFNSDAELATRVAESRVNLELGRALVRQSTDNTVAKWAVGTWQAAKDHMSRAVLDFGDFGTELYSHSGKEINSAMKTLGQAFGILCLEAPARGAILMMPQALAVKPAAEALYGDHIPSAVELSLKASALRQGNKELMSSAESIAQAMNFLEYASEQSGAGFGKLFRSAGLGLFGGKAMGEAVEQVDGLIPRSVTEAWGSRLRTWINKAVGTTDDFLKGHMRNQVNAVAHAIDAGGFASAPLVNSGAIESFIRTGNREVLGEAAGLVAGNPRKFVNDAVKAAIKKNEMDMTYRGGVRYVLADMMARNHWGPEEMTNWLKTAGYDGIVEEMMEERYSDFVKGLFGLDDRSAEDKGFFQNIRQAFSNLNPGWEQLTAEAVGFAVPLGIRTAVFQIQKAAGGSDLSFVQNYSSTIREFNGADNIVEAKGDTFFRVAEDEISNMKSRLRGRDADGNETGLEVELEKMNAVLDAENADSDRRREVTSEKVREISDLKGRIKVAEDQLARQKTVQGSAGYNADQIRAFEATNVSGVQEGETPTDEQAKRGVTAQNVMIQGAARAGEIIARGRATSMDPKKMPLAKRIVSRVSGIIGGLVTGDLSMAMYDPTAWSMVDRGMDRNVVTRLADAYDRHYDEAKAALVTLNSKAVSEGTRESVEPTSDEIRERMYKGYEDEAKAIMTSYLAAKGIRIFSNREMIAQATRVVREKYGTTDGHEDEVSETRDSIAEYTLRLLSNGSVQSTEAREITRGIINISDDSPFKDDVILDATMRLAGFAGLEQTCELRPETNVKDALRGRSVPFDTVKRIAGYDLSSLTDEQQADISEIASRLGYRPDSGVDHKTTMAFTPTALANLNTRVVRLCQQALATSARGVRTFRSNPSKPELGDRTREASGNFVRVSEDPRGGFYWYETDKDGTQKRLRADDEASLVSVMSAKGYSPVSTDVVFTQAREIRSRSAAVMLEKLGLTEKYLRAALNSTDTKDALRDNRKIHPAFRMKLGSDNRLHRYTYAEAEAAFNEELANALRYKDVMSMSDGDKLRAFRFSETDTDNVIRKRIVDAETDYRNVFGSEQEQNGYLSTIEKVLSSRGVQLPGASNLSYSSVLAGQKNWYTFSTRLLNFNEGSAYVLVDLNRDTDYDGPLLHRAVSNGLMANRALWAYNPETKSYPKFASVLRDVVKRLNRVGNDLARASASARRFGERDAMASLVDSLTGGTNLESPKIDTIVWLATHAVLGQAGREAARSKSTSSYPSASARLADAIRQTPEFYPFLGFVDLILGGNGFANVKESGQPATAGVAYLARQFSGMENFSTADLLKNGLLPVKDDGSRMGVSEFMEKINKAVESRTKTELAAADREKLEKAAEGPAAGFVAEIMRQAGLKTSDDLRDFMARILSAAGVRAGNTADLSDWNRIVERQRMLNDTREIEIQSLSEELAAKDEEISRLQAENSASLSTISALQAERDELASRLNQVRSVREAAVPQPEPPVSDVGSTATDGIEPVDLSSFGSEQALGAEAQDVADDYGGSAEDDDTAMGSFSAPNASDAPSSLSSPDDVDGTWVNPETPTMSPEARRHFVWTVTEALKARGLSEREEDFKGMARALFPCISDVDRDAIFGDFSSFLDKARETKADDQNLLDAVQEYVNEREDRTSDSDGWNDKSVAAYNSLKPMLEMMETSVPLTKRNFQGLVTFLRNETDRRLAELSPSASEEAAADRVPTGLERRYTLLRDLLNPRSLDVKDDGASVAERLAAHAVLVESVLGDSEDARRVLGDLVRTFSADVKSESGIVRPENPAAAAFLSFLSSLTDPGVRKSIMLLVSSSVTCDSVAIDNVFVRDDTDPEGHVTTSKTNDLVIHGSSNVRGSVSVNMVSETFLPLAGMMQTEVAAVEKAFQRSLEGADFRTMGYANPTDGFGGEEVQTSSNPENPRSKTVYNFAPRTNLLQDLYTFRHNAAQVAASLERSLGRDNAISAMLTSEMMYSRMKRTILRSEDYNGLIRMRRLFLKFATTSSDKYPDALGVIDSILVALSTGDGKTARKVTRDDVVNIVQNAFTTGNLTHASLSFPGSSAMTTDEWYTLFNEFTQSLPDTVVPARPVKGRTVRDSSVAVAAPGAIPIVLRYMTSESTGPFAFRTLAEQIVRRDAERDYWIGYGERRFAEGRSSYRYFGANQPVGSAYGFAKGEDQSAARAGLSKFVEDRIASMGGIDGIVMRSLQTMTWPDVARTPIMARNLSVDYSPIEVGEACTYSYQGGQDGPLAQRRGIWYIPLFAGDHACNNLLQIPTGVQANRAGNAVPFDAAAAEVNGEAGVSKMIDDTKRSAITSACAPSYPMVGAKVEFDLTDGIPLVKSAKFGENRTHVMLNLADQDGHKFSQEAMHGQTVCAGFGPDNIRATSKNPKLSIAKFHELGTGEELSFKKSASSVVTDDSIHNGGTFPPGTMAGAYQDYVLGYRSEEERKYNSDSATDEDSYKVGPLKSRTYQIVTSTDGDRCTGGTTILDFVKGKLKGGMKPEAVLALEVRTVDWTTGKMSDPVKLSDTLDGLDIVETQGLNTGTSQGKTQFAISYRDNTMLAYKVANIAHNSVPHVGYNGKNYTIDFETKAVEQLMRVNGGLDSLGVSAQNQVISTLNSYAIVAGAVAADSDSVEKALKDEPRLQRLIADGADPDGLEYRKLRAEIVAKRIRENILAPVNKVTAVLTSCGATRDKDGTVVDHCESAMRRDIHHGSVCFAEDEVSSGGLYEGFKRRLALCEVNIKDSGFRYGMFLDTESDGFRKLFGTTDPLALNEAMERELMSIATSDAAFAAERRAYARMPKGTPVPESYKKAKDECFGLRKAFLSCFVDHFGQRMDLKTYVNKKGRPCYHFVSMSFEDLFVGDGNGGSRFDRTALHLGEDGVHLDVYDYKTRKRDEAKSSKGKMIFLAGSAFLAPRTPSYNGGMVLQVVRASLPVTDEEKADGVMMPGEDGLVALDPNTLDILGCDNDGDESALSVFSPDGNGVCQYGDIEKCLPGTDVSTWDHSVMSSSALENAANRKALLEKAASVDADGIRYVSSKDGSFEFTKNGRRACANQLLQGLVDMAHQLQVPPGTGRRGFASPTSGLTKAQPFDDSRWWKRDPKEETGFVEAVRLMDVMPPDIIEKVKPEDIATSKVNLGNMDIQNRATLSGKKAQQARGAIVQAASSLLISFSSCCFVNRKDGKNPFGLFNVPDGRDNVLPDEIQAFMRHFDGLSNATFDEMKERICARLGLSPEMIDTLVCDLLSRDTIPTTDRDWYEALKQYILSVREKTPDGAAVWKLGDTSRIPPELDLSRLFMAKVSDKFDDTWSRKADAVVFGGAADARSRREALLRFVGLREGSEAGSLVYDASPETPRGRLASMFLRLNPKLRSYILGAASEGSGHNDVVGYLMWFSGAMHGTLSDARKGGTGDLAAADTFLKLHKDRFVTYMFKRRAWKTAKNFAHAVNFAQADPGAPNAYSRVADAAKAFADVMGVSFQGLPGGIKKVLLDMRQATKMAYSCGLVNAETPQARAFYAVNAVDDKPDANSNLVDAFRAQGNAALPDLEFVDSVIRDCSGRDTVNAKDRDELRNGISSVPYVIAALQTIPKTGFTKDYESSLRFFRAISEGSGLGNAPALGLRRGIEAMFSFVYSLVATSNEGVKYPGFTYLGARADTRYSLSTDAAVRGSVREIANYGIGTNVLQTIFQTFSVRDEASMRRVREAMAAIMEGQFDRTQRTHRYSDTERGGYTRVRSFDISLQNLSLALSEANIRSDTRYQLVKTVETLGNVIKEIAKSTGADPAKVSIPPSQLFNQILPVYIAMTQPVEGTPSYEQFSGSILAVMPGLYRKWSARQAANDRAFRSVADKYMHLDDGTFSYIDALSVLKFAPVNVTATARSLPKELRADRDVFRATLGNLTSGNVVGDYRPIRQNPENRSLVDIFAYGNVLFRAARLSDAFASESPRNDDAGDKTRSVVEAVRAEDVMDATDTAPSVSDSLAGLVEGVKQTLGATSGLDVTVEGGTMYIRGQITGEKALKRRGISKPVNTVIRIDLCPDGYGKTGADLNSVPDATSITNALRSAGIVDISVRDFLTKLTLEERKSLVRRVMPEALGTGAEGYALRSPVWSIGTDGILTLAGAIKLRKASDKTLYHEYFHAMVGMMRSLGMFSGGEAQALARRFGKARGSYEMFDEERAADAFSEFVRTKSRKSTGPVAAFFQKVYDFVKRLVEVLQNKGFRYDETVTVGDTAVAGEKVLFNMVMSGTVLDSLDSAKLVAKRLDASHQVKSGLAENAMERLGKALEFQWQDKFDDSGLDAMERAQANLYSRRMTELFDSGNPVSSFQEQVDGLLMKRKAGVRSASRGGSAASTVAPEVSTEDAVALEIAGSLGDKVTPGNGITGRTTAEVSRMQQFGHAVAQAIAGGLDAIDPAVRGLLESQSDLSKIALSEKIYEVVTAGIVDAANMLGVDLPSQEQRLKNLVYANMLHLYSDLSNALGYGGKKNPIVHAKDNKGKYTRQKTHVSRQDVAAFLLTAGGLSYSDIAKDALGRLAEIRAIAERGNPNLLKCINHFTVNLLHVVNKTKVKGDPIREILAGVKLGEIDVDTGRYEPPKEDTAATSPLAVRNRRNYMFGTSLFDEALTLTVKTALTVSAAKKLYDVLGIVPESLTGEKIPGGRGIRITPVNRRTGDKVEAPIDLAEVSDALGIGLEDLLSDSTFVDPFAEVGVYLNNPGEWMSSTVRNTFGGKPLREMFQDEHFRMKGIVDRFRRRQNWWAMYLGENFTEGTPLLAVKKDKGHFVFDNGHVAYDEEGHERVGFDNYRRRAFGIGKARGITTDVKLNRANKEVIDFWLKAAYAKARGDSVIHTGVEGFYFTAADLFKRENVRWTEDDFSKENVLKAYNGSKVGRQRSRIWIALAELASDNQLPKHVRDEMDVYGNFVKALVSTLNEVSSMVMDPGLNLSPADVNGLVLRGLFRRGVAEFTQDSKGEPARGCVTVGVDAVERHWLSSGTRSKLMSAGRDAAMLTREKLIESSMEAYRECADMVNKSPWMSEGDGRHFNTFGCQLPFFAGRGVFMYWANQIGKDAKKDVSQRMNDYENSFLQTLKAEDGAVTQSQLSLLHDVFNLGDEVGTSLRESIANGEYARGTKKSMSTGLELSAEDLLHSHRIGEVIYRRLGEIAWAKENHEPLVRRLGGVGSVARMIDMYEQLVGERTSWGCYGLNASQNYRLNGTLPANYQIFHAVNVKLEDAMRTLQFRNTFVNFLFTQDERGMPVAYAKPSLVSKGYADDGIPESVWEMAARWWAESNGRTYDESVSGRVNAARLYDEIITSNKTKNVNGRHFRMLDGESRAGLNSVADFAAVDDDTTSDDVNVRNALNGGEAYGYAKMLFNIRRVPTGKAQSLLMQRVANYSKTLSVQQSAFFPIATKFESSVAAVGFWTMMGSNCSPELARKLDKTAKAIDAKLHTNFSDTINRNFVGFKDIIEMMDTDDPFLAEAIQLCDTLGISLSDRLVNPTETDKAIVEADMLRTVDYVRRHFGDETATFVKGMMDGFLFRGSERAFSYALNATKIATALQIAQKCEAKCRREGRAFNLVKEVRPYAAYLNAEIGGIDPLRYAWANPKFRRLMNASMFSWEWTKGAWAAGGGEVIEEALGGGHFTTPEMRAHLLGRWLWMYGTVMIGVPAVAQAIVYGVSKLLGYAPDDDDKIWSGDNEDKHRYEAFDITPLLKALGNTESTVGRIAIAAKSVPILGNLVPAYTGRDPYNTTGGRRYYMHFGKQGWEFFRWFSHPEQQFFSKLSMPLQKLMEGLLGYNPGSREYDLAFSKMGMAERWLNPFAGTDSAVFNLAKAFVPFSWNAMSSYGDAGALSVLGPVSMGTSYMAAVKDAQAKLTAWAMNDRAGYSFGYLSGKNRKRNVSIVRSILKDAERNGMDPRTILTEATGLASKPLYTMLFDLLPTHPDDEVDETELRRVARGINRLNLVQKQVFSSVEEKLGRHGMPWSDLSDMDKVRIRSTIKAALRNPFTLDEKALDEARQADPLFANLELETRQAANGGDGLANFLATDKVPETIFGIPVVTKDYTETDLAFFEEHPEAGGYYDMEDGDGEPEPPEGGPTDGGVPVQGASKGGKSYVTGSPYGTDFSLSFESKPVAVKGADGKTYYRPTKDRAGKYDIGGYRTYWSAKQKKLVEHNNDGLLPETAYLDGKKKTDAYFASVTNRAYRKYGVDPKTLGKGLDTAARDIVFNTGGADFADNSPKLAKIVTDLRKRGIGANDAFGMAMALEQDSYGWQNDRRFAARGGLVMDELSKSQNPTVRKFADAYRTGWDSVKDYGYRNDGKTRKGTGWLGELKTSDGGVATEYTSQSNAVKVNGKRIDFPTLVPTLSKDEIRMMTDDIIPNHKAVPDAIMQKAVDHALLRLKNGKSVFVNDGPSNTGMEDAYGTNWERHKAGMREAAKIADELSLDYTARGSK